MSTLTPTTRALTWCLHLLIIGLLALTVVRALGTGESRTGLIVAVCTALGVAYAVGPLLPRISGSRRAAALWLGVVGAVWLVLLVLTADALWLAFPLYFLQLHLLPRRSGLISVVATAVAAIVAFSAHQGAFAAANAIGPALGAAVAVAVVWGYQALYRESEQRRRLIEELTTTRADLAAAQHTAGVLAERERLAREIHDTLAQGLSSIQLLLRAAERALPARPEAAERYIDQARQTSVDNLAEARRFVAALTPPTWKAPPWPEPWNGCAPRPAPSIPSPPASASPASPYPCPPPTKSPCCASRSPRCPTPSVTHTPPRPR